VATASLIRSAEGSSAVVNFILLPMAFLTGAFGPTRRYPEALRIIGDVLPLKYFLDIVDAVYLHGRGIWTQPRALAMLGVWAATGLVVGTLKFRWEPRER
jgi:ABC-2 type transport system permease protein